MTCLCINSGPEHLESFPLTLSVTLIDVLFSMSILTSSSVFWENFISTVLPVILQKRSFPGMPSPIGKTGILCYLSLCIFLWLVVGLEQFFSWDSRMLGCDEISLGYLPTIGKKKNSNNRLVSTHCSIHRYVWKNLSVQKCFSPEICEEIFVSFIHMAHFRIKWTDNYKAWVHGAVTKRMSIGLNNMHIANSHEVKYYNRTSSGSLSKTHPPSLPLHPPVNNVQYVI